MGSLQDLCLEVIRTELEVESTKFEDGCFRSVPSSQLAQLAKPGTKPLHLKSLTFFINSELEEIDFESFAVDVDIEAILQTGIFKWFRHLHVLRLNKFKISDFGLAHVAESMSYLMSLDFAGSNGFTFDGLVCLQLLTNLTSINIEECRIEILWWPFETQRFERVSIGGNECGPFLLQSIGERCHETLVDLSVWGCNCIPSPNAGRAFSVTEWPRLQSLDLRWGSAGSLLPSSALELHDIFIATLSLTHLDCGHLSIGDEFIFSIEQIPLRWLNLQSTNISFNSVAHLSKLIDLEYLDLSSTSLQSNSTERMWSFSKLVNLRYLNLSNSGIQISAEHESHMLRRMERREIDEDDREEIDELSQQPQLQEATRDKMMLFPPSLRVLGLSGLRLGFTEALCGHVAALQRLRTLVAKDLALPPHHWLVMLKTHPKLKDLHISGSDVPAAVLATCLESCRRSLESFEADGTAISLKELKGSKPFPRLMTATFPTAIALHSDFVRVAGRVFPLLSVDASTDAIAPTRPTASDVTMSEPAGAGVGAQAASSSSASAWRSSKKKRSTTLSTASGKGTRVDAGPPLWLVEFEQRMWWRRWREENGQADVGPEHCVSAVIDMPLNSSICTTTSEVEEGKDLGARSEVATSRDVPADEGGPSIPPRGASVDDILAARGRPTSRFRPPGLRLVGSKPAPSASASPPCLSTWTGMGSGVQATRTFLRSVAEWRDGTVVVTEEGRELPDVAYDKDNLTARYLGI